jgi:hypothetical protein
MRERRRRMGVQLALGVPPLEHWEEPLKWLTPAERERIESPQVLPALAARDSDSLAAAASTGQSMSGTSLRLEHLRGCGTRG